MSFVLCFIVGCGVGAFGLYWFQKNQTSECKNALDNSAFGYLDELFIKHPYLMSLIKSNISDSEYKNVREFLL